jgi:hypothetical protein
LGKTNLFGYVISYAGLMHDQLIASFITEGSLPRNYYLNLSQNAPSILLDGVPARARLNTWLQHDDASLYFG